MHSETNKPRPAVSVILPAYNAEKYLKEAVDSILNQTFRDFELIIVDDGSTDGTAKVLAGFSDDRIVRARNIENIGLARTIAKCISMSRGNYILRMDADDVSLPERIDKQVRFMDSHPRVSISGTQVRLFGPGIGSESAAKLPTSVAGTEGAMLAGNQIAPQSAIIRAKDIIEKGLAYGDGYRYENGYDFFVRAMGAGLHLANLSDILYEKRIHPGQMSGAFEDRVRQVEMAKIQKRCFSYLIRSLRCLHIGYARHLFAYAWARCSKKLAFTYKKIYLKKKERDFYAIPFERCIHSSCDAEPLKDREILDIAAVAFNNAEVIGWQIQLVRKYLKDPHSYTVFDNSNDDQRSAEIRNICAAERAAYVRLPKNHSTRTASHAVAMNWIYKNYLKRRNAEYFGFLDHDTFPTKDTGLVDMVRTQGFYGHLQERGRIWHLWAGFCFFKANMMPKNLDFSNGTIDGDVVEAGGMNWKKLYSKADRARVIFPSFRYEKIRESGNQSRSAIDETMDSVGIIGDWMHVFSSSGWKKLGDQDDRDDKIHAIISKLLS